MKTYPYVIKIRIIVQLSLDILQISYNWKLLLGYPGVFEHTHNNTLNQIDVFMYDRAKYLLCI